MTWNCTFGVNPLWRFPNSNHDSYVILDTCFHVFLPLTFPCTAPHLQWRNRQGGAECPPRDFWPGNFCWRIGKKEAGKKGKRGENWEEKVENWKWKQENVRKRGEDLFFFFFCFSLLKTTKICFGSTKMGIFYREKAFHAGKKNQEKWLCPLRKICLLRPCSFGVTFHSLDVTHSKSTTLSKSARKRKTMLAHVGWPT